MGRCAGAAIARGAVQRTGSHSGNRRRGVGRGCGVLCGWVACATTACIPRVHGDGWQQRRQTTKGLRWWRCWRHQRERGNNRMCTTDRSTGWTRAKGALDPRNGTQHRFVTRVRQAQSAHVFCALQPHLGLGGVRKGTEPQQGMGTGTRGASDLRAAHSNVGSQCTWVGATKHTRKSVSETMEERVLLQCEQTSTVSTSDNVVMCMIYCLASKSAARPASVSTSVRNTCANGLQFPSRLWAWPEFASSRIGNRTNLKSCWKSRNTWEATQKTCEGAATRACTRCETSVTHTTTHIGKYSCHVLGWVCKRPTPKCSKYDCIMTVGFGNLGDNKQGETAS